MDIHSIKLSLIVPIDIKRFIKNVIYSRGYSQKAYFIQPIIMCSHLKFISTCIILSFIFFPGLAQSNFTKNDIDGLWKSTKAGAEIFIRISGSSATITSIGTSSLTKKIIGGNLYENITYQGNGKWLSTRKSWIYPGVSGNNSEKGHWEVSTEEPKRPILKLSSDKTILSALEHWTFKRDDGNPILSNEQSSKISDIQVKAILDIFFADKTSSLKVNEEDRKQALRMLNELLDLSCKMSSAEALFSKTFSFNPSIMGIVRSLITKAYQVCYKLDGKYYISIRNTITLANKTSFQNRLDFDEW